jgi:hypothetical protein
MFVVLLVKQAILAMRPDLVAAVSLAKREVMSVVLLVKKEIRVI